MAKVFVIQDPGISRDFSSALDYGSLFFLLEKNDRPSYDPKIVHTKLQKILGDNFSSEDYIVWAGGDPMAPVLVGMVLEELGFDRFKNLRWERVRDRNKRRTGEGYYVPVTIDLP
jgi:hypothetical protein